MKRKTCFQLCILVALVVLMLPLVGASSIASAMMNDNTVVICCNVLPGNNSVALVAVAVTVANDMNNDLTIAAMAATNQSAGAIAKKQLILSSVVDSDLTEFPMSTSSDTAGATICAAEPGTAGADSLKFPMVSSSSLTADMYLG